MEPVSGIEKLSPAQIYGQKLFTSEKVETGIKGSASPKTPQGYQKLSPIPFHRGDMDNLSEATYGGIENQLKPDWLKFWSMTFGSAGKLEWCQTVDLLERTSGIPKGFLNLLPSFRYWSLNETILGNLGDSKNFNQPKLRLQTFFSGQG